MTRLDHVALAQHVVGRNTATLESMVSRIHRAFYKGEITGTKAAALERRAYALFEAKRAK